jgi:hypothetical protein
MSISVEDIKNIIECIKKESINFFQNDMKLDIVEIKPIQDYLSLGHFSSIELNSNINLIISLDIEDKLFDILFDKFFKDGVEESEKDELVNALPDEIINIIVGLSINSFPQKYREMVLGLPLELKKEEIQDILDINISQSCKITTLDGSLICTVIYKKN